MKKSNLYISLWTKSLPEIIRRLKNISSTEPIQLKSEDFHRVGNRQKYSFNLEFKDGLVSNNIGGSAVARDLEAVLQNNSVVKELIKSGHYKFKMDKDYLLWITQIEE